MINVLHVFGRMVRGGAEIRTLEVMRNIDRKQFNLNFCCLSGLPGELDDEIRALGGKVLPVRISPGFPRQFRDLCRALEVKVVHSHVHMSSGLMLLLAKSVNVPVRIAHFRSMQDGRGDSLQRKIKNKIMKNLIDRYATNILAVSEGAMAAAWGSNWEQDARCQVVYNGFEVANYAEIVNREGINKEFGIPADAKIYIHVGRMVKAKNHERLISIFGKIIESQPESVLLLVGRKSPEIEEVIQRKVAEGGMSERVVLAGERLDVPRLLKAANLTLFPSLWEGLPGAVLESCAAGTPVLASDLPGVREIAALIPRKDLVSVMPLAKSDREWASMAVDISLNRNSKLDLNPTELFQETPFNLQSCTQSLSRIWGGGMTSTGKRGLAKAMKFYFLLLFLVISLFMFLGQQYLLNFSTSRLCLLSTIIMFFSILCIVRSTPRTLWSIPAVYISVFSLFHFGIISIYGLRGDLPAEWAILLKEWINGYNFKHAVILVTIGITSYSAGVFLAKIFFREPENLGNSIKPGPTPGLSKVGFLLVAISFSLWIFTVVRTGGVGLLLDSYSSFRYATGGISLNYTYYFLGLGLFFLVVASPSRMRRLGIGIFVLFSIFALPLGLRGEVLFPVFTSLAIMSMRKIPVSSKTLIVICTCFLVLITVIKQVRQVGLGRVDVAEITANPINGLIEMGGSIRPVVEVTRWTDRGDDYILGSSYWAPIDRILVYFIPGWTRPPIDEDDRVLGNIVSERSGAIGFSVIAEAYYNFGQIGVAVIMIATGLVLSILDSLKPTPLNQLYIGVILLPLMTEIRNTFIFVPTSIAIGLVAVWVLKKYSMNKDVPVGLDIKFGT